MNKPRRDQDVIAKVDRVGFTSAATFQAARSLLLRSGFGIVRDHSFKNVNDGFFQAPYGRACEMTNQGTRTRIFVKYQPRFRKLAPMRIDLVPADVRGLRRPELETILQAFAPYRLVVVEIALDFGRESK
jgi:hypothetical protein